MEKCFDKIIFHACLHSYVNRKPGMHKAGYITLNPNVMRIILAMLDEFQLDKYSQSDIIIKLLMSIKGKKLRRRKAVGRFLFSNKLTNFIECVIRYFTDRTNRYSKSLLKEIIEHCVYFARHDDIEPSLKIRVALVSECMNAINRHKMDGRRKKFLQSVIKSYTNYNFNVNTEIDEISYSNSDG